MTDRARYYLEKAVPELEDLERKGVYNKREITMIMRRRTDFEHRILGRGSSTRDYLRYSDFEINVERLRKKRISRLAKAGAVDTKPSISDWAGSRRILFTYDRGIRKYPGASELWAAYLRFAKKNGSVKVVYNVYSRLLQLQPRNVEAWLSAAKYEFETNANAKGARVLLQRGLRFNAENPIMWLQYAQFELTYIYKLLARRKVLGLINQSQQKSEMEREERQLQKKISKGDAAGEHLQDKIELPELQEEEVKEELSHLPEADMDMLGNPETNPALRGDIVLAIFDSCVPALVNRLPKDSVLITKRDKTFEIAYAFLNLFDQFEELNRDYLYSHVLQYLQRNYPQDQRTLIIDITMPMRNANVDDELLPELLHLSVNKFIAYKVKSYNAEERYALTNKFTTYLNERFTHLSSTKGLDNTTAILKAIVQKCQSV